MKLLHSEIDRHEGFANPASLLLTVDKLPANDEFIYKEVVFKDQTLYYAECDGVVKFYAHSPSNEHGYAGRIFRLKMEDGSFKDIKGPWSSRAGAMNRYFPHCVDCVITEEVTGYRISSAISLDLANRIAKEAGVTLTEELSDHDITYRIEETS